MIFASNRGAANQVPMVGWDYIIKNREGIFRPIFGKFHKNLKNRHLFLWPKNSALIMRKSTFYLTFTITVQFLQFTTPAWQ
jgi:hypothetical protein